MQNGAWKVQVLQNHFAAGTMLHVFCNFFCILQGILSVLALILLWRLYPRDANYERAAAQSLQFGFTQWCAFARTLRFVVWLALNVFDFTSTTTAMITPYLCMAFLPSLKQPI